MKTKETVIYDSYYTVEKEEQAREYLFENYAEEEGWKTPEDVPNQRISNEIYFQDSDSWEELQNGLKKLLKANYGLLTGYCGRWYGNVAGGKFIHTIDDLLSAIHHLDYIRIVDRNGHFIIEGDHHDGSDRYELKLLTKKGYEYADRNYFAKDRKLHNTITNCNFFSALPKFAKRIYRI